MNFYKIGINYHRKAVVVGVKLMRLSHNYLYARIAAYLQSWFPKALCVTKYICISLITSYTTHVVIFSFLTSKVPVLVYENTNW